MVEKRIREMFAGAGAEGVLHAVPVEGSRTPGRWPSAPTSPS